METYSYSTHFDGFMNLSLAPEAQVYCDRRCESSHLYEAPLCSPTITQEDSTIISPDSLYSPSGGCQYDDRLYPSQLRKAITNTTNTYFDNCHFQQWTVDDSRRPIPSPGLFSEHPYLQENHCTPMLQLRTASTSTTDANFDKSDFQKWTVDDSRKLITSQGLLGGCSYLQQCHCNSMVCNCNSKPLYINSPDTGELKSYHVLSHCKGQLHPETTTENIRRFPDGSEPQPALRSFLPVAALPWFTIYDMDNRTVYTLSDDLAFHTDLAMEGASDLILPGSCLDYKAKRPCRCSKSQCLKLYCECFANGEFCRNCNCSNCYNNMDHESERHEAMKAYLDKNPEAFKPKTVKLKRKCRHTKGCNYKRSGCLKNYCDCYGAKIMCSSMCKCIECKNDEERRSSKYLRNKKQYADTESLLRTCASIEVVRAACACLLVRAEVAEREQYSASNAEQMIIEEFGKCLEQMLQKDPH